MLRVRCSALFVTHYNVTSSSQPANVGDSRFALSLFCVPRVVSPADSHRAPAAPAFAAAPAFDCRATRCVRLVGVGSSLSRLAPLLFSAGVARDGVARAVSQRGAASSALFSLQPAQRSRLVQPHRQTSALHQGRVILPQVVERTGSIWFFGSFTNRTIQGSPVRDHSCNKAISLTSRFEE